jgi:hypothetical protein
MDILRQAAQQALEAWDRSRQWPFPIRPDKEFDALRAALAQLKYEEAPPPKWLDKNWRVTPNALPQVGFDSTLAALWAAKAESAKAKESKHE